MSILYNFLGGNFKESNQTQLSDYAQELIEASFADLDAKEIRDYHVHLAGIGSGNTGCFINPNMQSVLSLRQHIIYKVILSASGIRQLNTADHQYVQRLVALSKGFPYKMKMGLLALDTFYNHKGEPNWNKTLLYVPNQYVMEVYRNYPAIFFPIISIHPYRKDAIEELEKWAQQGVKIVKWLPNSMNIDPSHKNCESFYKTLVKYDMTLLVHAGKEETLRIPGLQYLGNPLLLRRALETGVRIIVAHFASVGSNEDVEAKSKRKVKNFDLLLRLMNDSNYTSNLFCDISCALTLTRVGEALHTMLDAMYFQGRLVNGSDYPIPAINVTISTLHLKMKGYMNGNERKALNEIYKFNPLLFDYVLKRTIRSPKTGNKFSAQVFMPKNFLEMQLGFNP